MELGEWNIKRSPHFQGKCFFFFFQNQDDELQLVIMVFLIVAALKQDNELHSLSWFLFNVATFETTTTSVILVIMIFFLLLSLENQDNEHNLLS
jgi:hypothetical protein